MQSLQQRQNLTSDQVKQNTYAGKKNNFHSISPLINTGDGAAIGTTRQ
jgi:hypothetical protein